MKKWLTMFGTFAKIGAMTFGGGYAMLPILERELVDHRGWTTTEELMDCYAIGQCTPGVIAVNTATFIGYRKGGVSGAIACTAGVVTPSLVIIMVIAAFIQQFADLAAVQHAFAGIRVAVCALVLHTIIKLVRKGVTDKLTLAILILSFVAVVAWGVSPVIVVLAAGLAGAIGKGRA
jgi:chromate transporter